MSSWEDDTFSIRGEEIKAKKMELGDNVYHAIAYEGSFYALENSKVVTSALTSIKNVQDWIELNAKPNKRIGKILDKGIKERPTVSDQEPMVDALSGPKFTIIHFAKRDFRIMYKGNMVETWGTNAAAVKRADAYEAKYIKWVTAGKPEDTFKP